MTRKPDCGPVLAQALAAWLREFPAGTRLGLYGCGSFAQALLRHDPGALARLDVRFIVSRTDGASTWEGFPLVSPEDLAADPPEHVLLLSATFEHEMLPRLRFMPRAAVTTLGEAVEHYGLNRLLALATEGLPERMEAAARAIRAKLPPDRKLVLFVASSPPQHLIKIMREVVKLGYAVAILVETVKITQNISLEDYADQGYFHAWYEADRAPSLEFASLEALLQPYLVHAVAGMWSDEGLSSFMSRAQAPVIVEYIDIKQTVFKTDADAIAAMRLAPADYALEKEATRRVYVGAKGIITKESSESTDYLERLYDGHRPPHRLSFLHYCSSELAGEEGLEKFSSRNGELHLIYVAGVTNDPNWHSYPLCYSILRAGKLLEKQRIHLTVYNASDSTGQGFEDYVEYSKASPYFTYEFAVPYKELRSILPRYDCGWFCFDFTEARENPLFHRAAMGSKIFAYLESGLPVLVSPEMANMARFVEENGIGLVVPYASLDRLADTLAAADWDRLRRNVAKAQREWTYERHAPRLGAFYQCVAAGGPSPLDRP
ncbi:MAG TPA: hypothetical protein VN436_08175 [Holophaga sp.]|nr:hypothetical protein [Holophaga sp.]